MAKVLIKEVKCRKDLKKFVDFAEDLYGSNPYYVPQFFFDQMDTLDAKRNPAGNFCDFALYLAYIDGRIVGRVAAIVNNLANSQWHHNEVRFGWFDFIDNADVVDALMQKVEEFGRSRGMDKVVGPLGFTDFDPEGALVDGYDTPSTMALIYNHPYYIEHYERMGFRKDVDWVERRVQVPDVLPEKFTRVAELSEKRYRLHLKKINRRVIRRENYASKIFSLINECYKNLYNYTVMPDDMADKYIGFYLAILDLRYISVVENEKNELVAFGITMPSLASALQKSRGKFFPFGWYHLIKSIFIKHSDGAEMMLIGVRPDYRGTGANALLFVDLFARFQKLGIKWAETNAILETNTKNLAHWDYFPHIYTRRRRSYIKDLSSPHIFNADTLC